MAITFLVILGPNTPVFRILYRVVPGLSFFRFPQRLWAFDLLFLTLLAGLAMTRLQNWFTGRFTRRKRKVTQVEQWARSHALTVIFVVLVVFDLYFYHIPWNAIVDADTWLAPPTTAQVVEARAGSEHYRVFTYDVYDTFRAAYREANGWRGDLQPYIAQREFLQPSLNLIYDVPTADGYINLVPDCLAALWGTEKQSGVMDVPLVSAGGELSLKPGYAKLYGLYNVRFLISSQPIQDPDLFLVGVYGPGAHLYENRKSMPRAYAVPGAVWAEDVPAATLRDAGAVRSALGILASPTFDPEEQVLLFAPPREPNNPSSEFIANVDVADYQPNSVTIAAELSGPGYVVLSDTYYPGWEATVDDRPAPVFQANGCVRAVPIEIAGRHKIVFRFRSQPLYQGALISGISGMLWVILAVALVVQKRGKGRLLAD
jgi:hypothetical protein